MLKCDGAAGQVFDRRDLQYVVLRVLHARHLHTADGGLPRNVRRVVLAAQMRQQKVLCAVFKKLRQQVGARGVLEMPEVR